jgi:aspartyl-tRNA synthetase
MNANLMTPHFEVDLDRFEVLEAIGMNDERLEALTQVRLGNRVRNLRVLRGKDGLVLRGKTTTYYAKQLVQHAVMELDESRILANDIEVS